MPLTGNAYYPANGETPAEYNAGFEANAAIIDANETERTNTNKSASSLVVENATTDTANSIEAINFAGQTDYGNEPTAEVLHNYTDGDCRWYDNVGEGNTILRLNNSHNAVKRTDKDPLFVGSGEFITLYEHVDTGGGVFGYKPVLVVDKDGNFSWDNQGEFTRSVKFSNSKSDSTEPAFIYRTGSSSHSKVFEVRSGGADRVVTSLGLHASGSRAWQEVGPLMTDGYMFIFDEVNTTQHLKYGTSGTQYTVPNVVVKTFGSTSTNAHFVGQEWINTATREVFKAVAAGTGDDWVKLSV